MEPGSLCPRCCPSATIDSPTLHHDRWSAAHLLPDGDQSLGVLNARCRHLPPMIVPALPGPRVVSISVSFASVRGHPPTTARMLRLRSRTVPAGDGHTTGVLKIGRSAVRPRPWPLYLTCTNGIFLIFSFVLRLSCRPGIFFTASAENVAPLEFWLLSMRGLGAAR
jgi:hypothetical protein